MGVVRTRKDLHPDRPIDRFVQNPNPLSFFILLCLWVVAVPASWSEAAERRAEKWFKDAALRYAEHLSRLESRP